MKTSDKYWLRTILSLVILFSSLSLHAQEEGVVAGKNPGIDRWALKTNAVDWALTIPNIGVEFDLMNSEFNNMTLGLSARYNWNTYHKYAPPSVFNLFDVRPEFRWYYRSTPMTKSKWSIDKFLRERKKPRPWRAQYVGAYASYGDYTLKFGQKGYQGSVIGFGAVAGYGIPMYEYRSGAIDVELGFSVGLQVAQKDVFIHNHDGNYYANVLDKSKGWHLTPFPVVSELRVAFAWRHKSIKNKVKTDVEKLRIKRHFDRNKGDFSSPFETLTKEWYDENLGNTKSSKERREIMANDSLYKAGYKAELAKTVDNLKLNIAGVFPDEMKNSEREDIREYVAHLEKSFERIMKRAEKTAWTKFNKALKSAQAEKAKAEAKSLKAQQKAEKEAEEERLKSLTPEELKAEKEAAKAAKAAEKAAKAEKPEKVEKPAKAEKPEKAPKEPKEKKPRQKKDKSAEE